MATMKEQLDALVSLMKEKPADDPIQNVTGIIYGDSGGGKTKVGAQLAQKIREVRGGKVLYMDACNAWRTLKNHPELQDVTLIKYTGKSMLDALIFGLQSGDPRYEDFKVIVLDEVSTMLDMDCDLVLKVYSSKDDGKDPDILTQPDMGIATQRMRRTITDLLKQNVSVIMIAHEREDIDKQLGYALARPAFMPKFSRTIKEGLDFVVRMTASQKANNGALSYERVIQSHPSRLVVAKTRVGGLPLKTDPETWVAQVIKWMKGDVPNSTVEVVVNDTVSEVGTTDEGTDEFSNFVVE